ncbi:MAG: glycosyltransferase [Eubacteriales bacterium]|nr:glycosyltransferase [Eubacteriales bacterium]
MKHILILTGRFGMGHCCAAEAIRQEISAINPQAEVHIIDLIDYLFPRGSELIYCAFAHLVNRYSAVYNYLNRAAGRCSILPMNAVIMRKLDRLLCDHQADIVVSTLPICSQCISAYKQQRDAHIPLYTYITDIGAQDEWIVPHTDAYFVGARDTKDELIRKGICADRIHICGIPVRRDFLHPVSHASASGQTELLIMGGGLGLIPSSDTFLSALSRMHGIHLTVITGKNQALYTRLKAQYPSITVIGYTEQVAHYMRNADLLITKSGGITTFEAIHCATPLYVIHPFLMQEIGNAEYIERNHIGRVLWSNSDDVTYDILSLLQSHAQLTAMKQNMEQICRGLEATCPAAYFGGEAS